METKRSGHFTRRLLMAVLTAVIIVAGCSRKDDTRVLLKLIEESARLAEAPPYRRSAGNDHGRLHGHARWV